MEEVGLAFKEPVRKSDSAGLLICPVGSTDSEECRGGKITSYQGGFWYVLLSSTHVSDSLLGVWVPQCLHKPIV